MMPLGVPGTTTVPLNASFTIDGYRLSFDRDNNNIEKRIGIQSAQFQEFSIRGVLLVFSRDSFDQGIFISEDGIIIINYRYGDFADIFSMLQSEKPCSIQIIGIQVPSEAPFQIDRCLLYSGEEPP